MKFEYNIITGRNLLAEAVLHSLRAPDRIVGMLFLAACYGLESYYRNKMGVVEGDVGVFRGVAIGGFVSYFCSIILISRFVERVYVNCQLLSSINSVCGEGKLNRVFEIDASGIQIMEKGLVTAHYSWASMIKPKRVGSYILITTMHRDIAFDANRVPLDYLIQEWEQGQCGKNKK